MIGYSGATQLPTSQFLGSWQLMQLMRSLSVASRCHAELALTVTVRDLTPVAIWALAGGCAAGFDTKGHPQLSKTGGLIE
jgi:hypothetical protein